MSEALKKIPSLEQIPLEAAEDFVQAPYATDPLSPFGELVETASAVFKTTPKRHTGDNQTKQKGTLNTPKFIPTDDKKGHKYRKVTLSKMNLVSFEDFKTVVPTGMHTPEWFSVFEQLQGTAVAANTWKKYKSALNKYSLFCASCTATLTWPIPTQNINGFVMWCLEDAKLQPDTVKAYIFSLSHLQQVMGFGSIAFSKNLIAKLLIKGSKNWNATYGPIKRRDTVTFIRLKKIRRAIFRTSWTDFNKLAFWCLCLVAFYGSFRLGELMAKKEGKFDKTTTFLTKHATYDREKNVWTMWIKSPKSGNAQGENVYLFPVHSHKFCPVRVLRKYVKQKACKGLNDPQLPFFRWNSGTNITIKKVNSILRHIFPLCKGVKITGHCFRSGLISSAGNLPDVINDTHIKGWGRWRSDTFLRYELFDMEQKKYIFTKLVQSLF